MTTLEKIKALVDELLATPPGELADEGRDLRDMFAMARGFGFDPLAFIVPQSDAEADLFIDKALSLLFACRGDDLPPFDLGRYGEAV